MFRPYIDLFIDGQKVDFTIPIEIFMTFIHNDLHNPTVIRNSFSKTIKLDGTPNNNRIFGCFGNMERIISFKDGSYSSAYFNPSRKTEFILMRNYEILERGYVKLDKVIKKGKSLSYEITLYGGLGSFLYGLSYKDDGEKMKLSDLTYNYNLDIDVNKDTVFSAWQHINGIGQYTGSTYGVYDFINFAPCYNGIPENFTSDKVAIDVDSFANADDFDLSNQFVTSKDGYTTVNGWVMGELKKEYDEWQMKDLRSYLQRPVIRLKEIIKACCDKQNNGGYEVDLDSEFFSSSNPYYNDTWLTLPLLTEMEVNNSINDGSIILNGDKLSINDLGDNNFTVSIDFNLLISSLNTNTSPSEMGNLCTGAKKYYQGNINPALQYNRAFQVQLVIFDANGNAVGGSPAIRLYTYIDGTNDFNITPRYNSSVQTETGTFKYANSRWIFNDKTYTLTSNTVKYESGMYGMLYVDSDIINPYGSVQNSNVVFPEDGATSYIVEFSTGFFNERISNSDIKGYCLNKNLLLNSEHTPCDYFLGFLKMFNLHIWSDNVEKKIYVRQRKNYFTGNVIDIDRQVDRDSDITITPIVYDAKYYSFGVEYESYLSKKYKDDYGIDYGIQKVNTNYNFDSSTKSLLENIVYKGAVCNRGKSKYYINIHNRGEMEDIEYPPFMLDGCQTFLFKDGDTVEGSYITPKTSENSVSWWNTKFYDILPKPDFRDKDGKTVEGANVLLFYNGKVDMKGGDGFNIGFSISDDIPEFEQLNDGEPCWIWTYKTTVKKTPDYLPCFSRYKTNSNNWVTHSLDFGTPREIYVPDYGIDNSSDIYTKYWKNYLTDRFDMNTREIELKIRLKDRVNPDYLQNFVYFDGCYWLIEEIVDYNVCSQSTTKCKLVKVHNMDNYR